MTYPKLEVRHHYTPSAIQAKMLEEYVKRDADKIWNEFSDPLYELTALGFASLQSRIG